MTWSQREDTEGHMMLQFEKQNGHRGYGEGRQDGRVPGVFGNLLGEFCVNTKKKKRQIKDLRSPSESY